MRDLELEDLKLLDELVCAQLACFLSFFLFQGHLMDIIDGHQVLLDVVYIVVDTSIMWRVFGVLL